MSLCARYKGLRVENSPGNQLVYDRKRKEHWLFGGNPADDTSPEARLGDFWKASLVRCAPCSPLTLPVCFQPLKVVFHQAHTGRDIAASKVSRAQTEVR
jgi:hypothetical protein